MICLAEMPFASLRTPPIAIPLLSALLKNAGLDVKALYFNADFARDIGYESYLDVSKNAAYMVEWLEWPFAGIAWGWDEERENKALEAISHNVDEDWAARHNAWARRIRRDMVPVFLEKCVEKIKSVPDLRAVGFSCMFNLLPSLALGRKIREALPDVRLVYGGAALNGKIGMEVFDKVEWLDAVSTSEADDVAAEVFRRLQEGKPLDGLRGMAHRDRAARKICKTPGSEVPSGVFDGGPAPDFDGYFEAMREHGKTRFFTDDPHNIYLPFESSRGCWWRDKHPCAFCGFCGDYSYRLKPPENVISVLKSHREKYGAASFYATDANLSMKYFETFFPALKKIFPDGVNLYYEVKSNMNRDKIKTLAEAGVSRVQVGIESLSDHVLNLMSKGVSAIRNVFFLKCARQYGIHPYWYLLLGTFGETPEDCREIAALIPRLRHLVPPHIERAFVQMHRYSEYWRNPEPYADEMKPAVIYEALFPDSFDRSKLAYYFDAKWKQPLGAHAQKQLDEAREAVVRELREWKRRWNMKGKPALRLSGSGAEILDTRGEGTVKIVLDPKEAAIYSMLDDVTPKRAVLGKLEKNSGLCTRPEAERILDAFVEHGLAITDTGGELYLGLALRGELKSIGIGGAPHA